MNLNNDTPEFFYNCRRSRTTARATERHVRLQQAMRRLALSLSVVARDLDESHRRIFRIVVVARRTLYAGNAKNQWMPTSHLGMAPARPQGSLS